jgi:hypothetical protein
MSLLPLNKARVVYIELETIYANEHVFNVAKSRTPTARESQVCEDPNNALFALICIQ